jgi:integrase
VSRIRGNLKDKQVDKLIRRGEPGRHYDGRGLRLEIKGAGSASWVTRYQIAGIERWFGLGSAFDFTLAEARERNRKLVRQKLADGIDPVQARRAERTTKIAAAAKAMTFAEACAGYLEQHGGKWESAKHAKQWHQTLADYATPVIGKMPVADIDVPLVLKVLEQHVAAGRGSPAGSLWMTRRVTAGHLRGRIEAVLDWAKARGIRSGDNPAAWDVIGKVLPAHDAPKHHAALPYADIPTFMTELRARPGIPARALEFLIMVAGRSQEILRAKWRELDLDNAVWVVPAERMKMRKEHRVPLASAAVDLLRDLPTETGSDFVFIGSQVGKPLSEDTFNTLLRRMGRPVTPHGFRSSFRDWAGETTAFPHDVCEAALAHLKGKTERAYQRGDLFDKRRKLMEQWARYCTSPPKAAAANVVPMGGAR